MKTLYDYLNNLIYSTTETSSNLFAKLYNHISTTNENEI